MRVFPELLPVGDHLELAEIGGVVYTREHWPVANPKDASYIADYALQTKKPTPSEGSASMMHMDMMPAAHTHTHVDKD